MDTNSNCTKEKLKPWLVGLVVLVLIVAGWAIFGKNEKKRGGFLEDQPVLGKTKLTQQAATTEPITPAPAPAAKPNTYRDIVNQVMPAVVGISLPGAQPFLQAWNQQITDPAWPSNQAWGQGKTFWPSKEAEGEAPLNPAIPPAQAPTQQPMQTQTPMQGAVNNLSMVCPICGAVVTRQPGVPWTNVNCPACGAPMATTQANPQVQPQAWGFGGGFESRLFSMPCPNCKTIVERQRGTSWNSITCPNCGSSMSCPMFGGGPQAQAQPQAWNSLGGIFQTNMLSMPCPGCGTIVTRQQGEPWRNIKCPNCNSLMVCPSAGAVAQPAGWLQPSAKKTDQVPVKEEYLLCTNCGIKLNQTPGIPWTGAKCPGCGTVMAHMIKETNQTTDAATAQQQVWNPMPSAMAPNPTPAPQTPVVPAPQTPMQAVAQQGFQGRGSGLIISKRGYVLTSSHLILGAKTVNVTLFTAQGQKTFTGQVIAQADDRDLAVIQINSAGIDLPVAPIGNSDNMQVGSTVLAFGNPFGLSQTVTSGIVSAIRNSIVIQGHPLTNVIQTDAPINTGNCGGPLVNSKGEIIGINTAIYSPGQTNTGLGFAVPINQAKEIFSMYMDLPAAVQNQAMSVPPAGWQYLNAPCVRAYPTALTQNVPNPNVPTAPLMQNAPVQTPPVPRAPNQNRVNQNEDLPVWLGLNVQIMNDIIAEQLNVPVDRGILINEVYTNSPACSAGIKKGDVIIRFDGRRITDETQLRALLFEKKPGDKVRLTILRGRERIDAVIDTTGGAWQAPGQAPAAGRVALAPGQNPAVPPQGPPPPKKLNMLKGSEIETGSAELVTIGVAAITITPEIAFAYGLPETTQGILATEAEGLALKYGIKDGDIIKQVNGKPTPDLLSYLKVIKRANLTDGISFVVQRKNQLLEVVIKETINPATQRGI